jgi:acetaldehyde dehydrogenase
MTKKIKAAIIGPGNIGIDLMYKLRRSGVIEQTKMIGILPASEGYERARALGIEAFSNGVDALTADDGVELVFEATSAAAHLANAPKIKALGKRVIDLTPAAIGPYLVPAVGMSQINLETMDYNMVTCGGQATIPIMYAINRVCPVQYGEIVATIASKSAGPGTRANIDEFTQTTAKGLRLVGGAAKAKAIIILNPAEPPLLMRDTIYARVAEPDKEGITKSVEDMIKTIQSYVPGYELLIPPLFDGDKVTVMVRVEGLGDYLPKYSGNLDIMNCAAAAAGEEIARQLLAKRG